MREEGDRRGGCLELGGAGEELEGRQESGRRRDSDDWVEAGEKERRIRVLGWRLGM